MVSCGTCGEEDRFEYIDGSYCCTICFTQAHELREFEQDYAATGPTGTQTLTKEVTKKSSKKPKERKKIISSRDDGLSWTTTEAYTVVLREQVKSLIKLGIVPEIKDIVFKLYAQYLHKIKDAFVSTKEWKAQNKVRGRRDQHNMSKAKRTRIRYVTRRDVIGKVSHHPPNRVNLNSSAYLREKREQKSLLNTTSGVVAEDSEDGGGWSDDDDDVDATNKRDQSGAEDEGCKKSTRRKDKPSRVQRQVRLSLLKTVALCYIALRLLNYHISMPEILSLIRSYQLPYLKAVLLLPPKYKMCGQDKSQWFGKDIVPSCERLYNSATVVSKVLRLETLPPQSWETHLVKLLLDLNLPICLLDLLLELINLANLPSEHPISVKYEVISAAFIVIVLEIIFGLDGRTECLMSEYAERLQSKVNQTSPAAAGRMKLFNWSQWVTYMHRISHVKQELDSQVDDLLNIRDMEVVRNLLHHQSPMAHHAFPDYNAEVRESLSSLISTYLPPPHSHPAAAAPHTSSTHSQPTSFPSRHVALSTLTDTDCDRHRQNLVDANISFITSPACFLETIRGLEPGCALTLNEVRVVVNAARLELSREWRPDMSLYVRRGGAVDVGAGRAEGEGSDTAAAAHDDHPALCEGLLAMSIEELLTASDTLFITDPHARAAEPHPSNSEHTPDHAEDDLADRDVDSTDSNTDHIDKRNDSIDNQPDTITGSAATAAAVHSKNVDSSDEQVEGMDLDVASDVTSSVVEAEVEEEEAATPAGDLLASMYYEQKDDEECECEDVDVRGIDGADSKGTRAVIGDVAHGDGGKPRSNSSSSSESIVSDGHVSSTVDGLSDISLAGSVGSGKLGRVFTPREHTGQQSYTYTRGPAGGDMMVTSVTTTTITHLCTCHLKVDGTSSSSRARCDGDGDSTDGYGDTSQNVKCYDDEHVTDDSDVEQHSGEDTQRTTEEVRNSVDASTLMREVIYGEKSSNSQRMHDEVESTRHIHDGHHTTQHGLDRANITEPSPCGTHPHCSAPPRVLPEYISRFSKRKYFLHGRLRLMRLRGGIEREYVAESGAYKWLLQTLSDIVHCSHLTLYRAAICVEYLLQIERKQDRAALIHWLYHLDLAKMEGVRLV